MKTLMVPIPPSELHEAFQAIEDLPITASDEEVLATIEKKMDLNCRMYALRIAARVQAIVLFARGLGDVPTNHIFYGNTGHVEKVSQTFAEIAASAPLKNDNKVFMFQDPEMVLAWLQTPFECVAHG